MNDFGTGFLTGLVGTLNEGIDERRASAKKYFEKQLEIAQTSGVENRRRVKGQVRKSVGIANQLIAMGVPKDIIMAQANMNPEGLEDFAVTVEKLRMASPTPLTEQTFRDIYELHGGLKDSNEDFATFFSRMYDPIEEAAKADPEGFQQDARASIWGRMFGIDSMDRAKKKLGETVVYDGLTADQLIQYGDNAQPMTDENNFVTMNPEAIKALEGGAKLPYNTRSTINTDAEAAFSTALTELTQQLGASVEDSNAMLEILPQAAERAYKLLGGDDLQPAERKAALSAIERQMELAKSSLGEGLNSPVEEGVDEEATPTPETPQSPSDASPRASAEDNPQDVRGSLPNGKEVSFKFLSNNLDGTVTLLDEITNQEIQIPVSELEKLRRAVR